MRTFLRQLPFSRTSSLNSVPVGGSDFSVSDRQNKSSLTQRDKVYTSFSSSQSDGDGSQSGDTQMFERPEDINAVLRMQCVAGNSRFTVGPPANTPLASSPPRLESQAVLETRDESFLGFSSLRVCPRG